MGTRALIGMFVDGVIEYNYVHYDGYVTQGVGDQLIRYYSDDEAVIEDMVLGREMRSLYSPDEMTRDAYLDITSPMLPRSGIKSVSGFLDIADKQYGAEYAYLWNDEYGYWDCWLRNFATGNWITVDMYAVRDSEDSVVYAA